MNVMYNAPSVAALQGTPSALQRAPTQDLETLPSRPRATPCHLSAFLSSRSIANARPGRKALGLVFLGEMVSKRRGTMR